MKSTLWSALNLAWELGYTIAIPIVILGFGGAWLDKKLESSPLLLLAGIILSVIISSIAVYRKIKRISNN
ncbi:AtpZ/AtpI family protein [Candidatus Peregrinibacteria bacterium]|nr:AtpZ/AtpI family protein [Candidatus Peregrinibacteria bacterium]